MVSANDTRIGVTVARFRPSSDTDPFDDPAYVMMSRSDAQPSPIDTAWQLIRSKKTVAIGGSKGC